MVSECLCVRLTLRIHTGMMHRDSVLDAVLGDCCCDAKGPEKLINKMEGSRMK